MDNNKQPKPRKANPNKGRSLRMILWVSACFVVGTFLLIMPMLISGAETDAVIRIPKGATADNVRDTLAKYLGMDYMTKVDRLMIAHNVDWAQRHGSYKVSKGDTPMETLRRLSAGRQRSVKLTLNGFRNYDELADRMTRRLDFEASELTDSLLAPGVLERYGLTPDQKLALFINDTYEVYWSSSPGRVIRKIGRNYLGYWTEERKQKARELGLTPAEVMTLASIVDEETNALDEKGRVARVYINRLHKGMRLQADPTVRYAIGDFSIKRVAGDMLKYDSPYNTYVYGGLPPGPIRTTSKATLDAILDSTPTDELYMCAKEDFSGRHNFAVTFAEHQANAKRYQEELNRRNIH